MKHCEWCGGAMVCSECTPTPEQSDRKPAPFFTPEEIELVKEAAEFFEPDRAKWTQISEKMSAPSEKLVKESTDWKKLLNSLFGVTLNANDFFGWACADAVDVGITCERHFDCQHLDTLFECFKRWGHDGVHAFMCWHEGANTPFEDIKTKPGFIEATAWLETQPHGEMANAPSKEGE